ncbi:hypothetical protein PG993_003537 [Apiospora rasikravindrae]|uniref:F-box domain-containing protein n=1 Tax=Apiospora rasikravindrae TaxID=990691 RepID=A0ABR1TZW1_9PEZI
MPGILDLSNELLLEICSYLRPHPLLNITGRPFCCWTRILKEHDSASFAKLQTVNSLVRSCRHLYAVLISELYGYIPLLTSHHGLERFTRTVTEHEELGDYVRCASFNLPENATIVDFYQLFWLPNLAVLDLRGYQAWHAAEWEGDESPMGLSQVQTLRLLNCGAHEEALTELLKFPRALEALWYDANQGEWDGHYGDEPAAEFTCEAVRRSMATHAESLGKLVFTRPPLVHEGLGHGDAIDLEDFKDLRSLSIYQVFLVGLISNTRVSRCLPPSLEELEVFYDDSGYVDFLDEGEIAHPHWLLTLLEELKGPESKLKNLSRIRIVALEWTPGQGVEDEEGGPDSSNASSSDSGRDSRGPGDDVQLRGHPTSPWRPPKLLLDLLVQAGICFSIFLHPERRARLTPDDVNGFDDVWEDEWDSKIDSSPSFV